MSIIWKYHNNTFNIRNISKRFVCLLFLSRKVSILTLVWNSDSDFMSLHNAYKIYMYKYIILRESHHWSSIGWWSNTPVRTTMRIIWPELNALSRIKSLQYVGKKILHTHVYVWYIYIPTDFHCCTNPDKIAIWRVPPRSIWKFISFLNDKLNFRFIIVISCLFYGSSILTHLSYVTWMASSPSKCN